MTHHFQTENPNTTQAKGQGKHAAGRDQSDRGVDVGIGHGGSGLMLGVGNEERFFEKAVVMKNRIDCGRDGHEVAVQKK